MTKNFYNTPEEYLKDLQEFLKNEPQMKGEGHADFTRINEEQFKQLDKFKEYTIEQVRESNLIIEGLFKYIEESMEEEDLKKVKKNIAFGKVLNTYCNALCVKSQDGKYAVLLYEGLMLLLHKHGKLIMASHFPEKVLSCSRGIPAELKSEDYRKFASELIDNYKSLGSAMGAMVKFDLEFVSSHAFNLTLQELFVLCHELGHFFNGDLEDENNFYTLTEYNWQIFDDNKDHLMEFKADLTGFSIFEKAVQTKYKGLPRKYLIVVISQLFDILALLNEKSSESHPAPIDRMMNIISYFFGQDVAEKYLETYDSKEKLDEFFRFD